MNISNEPTELKVSFDTEKVYPSLEDLTVTPTTEEQYFKSEKYGYNEVFVNAIESDTIIIQPEREEKSYSGLYDRVIVNGEPNLVPENIPEGISMFGLDGTKKVLDTTDATATADDLIAPATAYVNGEKIEGAIIPIYGEFDYTYLEETISNTSVLGMAYSNDNKYRFEFLSQNGIIRIYNNDDELLLKSYNLTEIISGANTSDTGRIGCSIYFDEAGVKKCYVCFNCYVGSVTHSFIIVKFNTETKSFETSSVIKYDVSITERQPPFITFGNDHADLMSITMYNTQRRHYTRIGRITSSDFVPFFNEDSGGNTSVNGTHSGYAFGSNDKVIYRVGCKSGYSAYMLYDYNSNVVTNSLTTFSDFSCQPKGELCTYGGQLKRYELNTNNNTLSILDLIDDNGVNYTISLTGTSYTFVSNNILLSFVNSSTIRVYFIEKVNGKYNVDNYINLTISGWSNYVLYEKGLNISTNAVGIRNTTTRTIQIFESATDVITSLIIKGRRYDYVKGT